MNDSSAHLWPLGISPQDNPSCTECGITWAEHYTTPTCTITVPSAA